MKLSQFAKEIGVCYKTAWRYWQLGMLDAKQLPTGTIIVNGFRKEINEKEELKEEKIKEDGSN